MYGVGKELRHRRSVAPRRIAVTPEMPRRENAESRPPSLFSRRAGVPGFRYLWVSWRMDGATAVRATRTPSRCNSKQSPGARRRHKGLLLVGRKDADIAT